MFDANTIVSAALTPDGTARRALRVARASGTIALSEPVFAEIAEVLRRPKFSARLPPHRREDILEFLAAAAVWAAPRERVCDCRDAKDNKFLELALEAGAQLIVSGDDDLLVLDPWRNIRILRPAAFIQAIAAPPRVEGAAGGPT